MASQEFVGGADGVEVFPLSREQHLFADSSLASYDADAARELEERELGFLARVG